ncbi:MAG: zinc finger domain-containing protein [Thermoplasmata archaeon]
MSCEIFRNRRGQMMQENRCSSCGVVMKGKGTTIFTCPLCGETTVGRCAQCRDQSVPYLCEVCGFEGP